MTRDAERVGYLIVLCTIANTRLLKELTLASVSLFVQAPKLLLLCVVLRRVRTPPLIIRIKN